MFSRWIKLFSWISLISKHISKITEIFSQSWRSLTHLWRLKGQNSRNIEGRYNMSWMFVRVDDFVLLLQTAKVTLLVTSNSFKSKKKKKKRFFGDFLNSRLAALANQCLVPHAAYLVNSDQLERVDNSASFFCCLFVSALFAVGCGCASFWEVEPFSIKLLNFNE